MVEAMGLKVWHQGHLQWLDRASEFHKILKIGSKFIMGATQMDRQAENQSHYMPWRRLGGRVGVAPTHSRPRH
jgi:hypothetical protein